MNLVLIVIAIAAITPTSTNRCGVTDFLEQMIQSVNSIQQTRPGCQMYSAPRVGKAGPQGPPGPRGPAGVVDMARIEERVQQMIDENNKNLIRQHGWCFLGMRSRMIPDSSITASSYFDARFKPHAARLDNIISSQNLGSWASKRNAVGEWLQIDLATVREIAGIVTQGRPQTNQYIRSFKLSCGSVRNELTMVQSNGNDKVFTANTDVDSKVYNRFHEILSCRYVRIHPQTWNAHMSMRVELVDGICFNNTVPL